MREPKCPTCGAGEMHPREHKLLIRGFKYTDDKGRHWSQCLVCCGAYDANLVYDEARYNPNTGWYVEK